jgi:hypothetical protein
MKLDGGTRLSEDVCYLAIRNKQSLGVGQHEIETPGFRPMETQLEYSQLLTEPGHFNKEYRNANAVMDETMLQQSALTQYRFNNQLFARPYAGNFMGAGQPSLDKKDLESALFMKSEARVSKSNNLPGINIDRFDYLPLDPQELSHIETPKTWIRGGDATRDYVRRKLYPQKCLF